MPGESGDLRIRVAALEAAVGKVRHTVERLDDRMKGSEDARERYIPILEGLAEDARVTRLVAERAAAAQRAAQRFHLTLAQRFTAAIVALSAVGSLVLQVLR